MRGESWWRYQNLTGRQFLLPEDRSAGDILGLDGTALDRAMAGSAHPPWRVYVAGYSH